MPRSQRWGERQAAALPSGPAAPHFQVWMDGKLRALEEARASIFTHSLHYGFAVFEGIRSYRQADGTSAVFRLPEHIQRLFRGARILDMAVPFTPERIEEACVETLRACKLAEGYLRPLVYVGEGRMGIFAPENPVRVAVMAWEWGAYLGEEGLTKGVRVRVSSIVRAPVASQFARGKITGQYVSSIVAKAEAVRDGYDEAILLDKDGFCAEGSGENLFMVRDGALVTPPLSSPILAGITRATILALAAEEGIPAREARFTRDDLWLADEAFFTGTAAEVTPIREVDGRPLGEGRPGPLTRRLMDRFAAAIRGSGGAHPEWRTVYRV